MCNCYTGHLHTTQANVDILHLFNRGIFDPVEVLDYLVKRGRGPTRPRGEGPDVLSPTMFSIFVKGTCDWMADRPGCEGWLERFNIAGIHDPKQWGIILGEIEYREGLRQEIRELKKGKKLDEAKRGEGRLRCRSIIR